MSSTLVPTSLLLATALASITQQFHTQSYVAADIGRPKAVRTLKYRLAADCPLYTVLPLHWLPTMDSNIAQKTFELHNDIKTVDSVYEYNGEAQRQLNKDRPWKGDPHYFKHVQISAVALVKMVTHARSGGQYEIMGLMQGKIEKETFVILDAFALPVLGTETRVNAGSEADEYMVQYKMTSEQVGPH